MIFKKNPDIWKYMILTTFISVSPKTKFKFKITALLEKNNDFYKATHHEN